MRDHSTIGSRRGTGAAPETAQAGAPRRLPVGAEPHEEGTSFRVWAPARDQVAVLIEGTDALSGPLPEPRATPLERTPGGYFEGTVPGIGPGALYRFRLDQDPTPYPDPASRYQPRGPHGPSQVIDPEGFHWTDGGWKGVAPSDGPQRRHVLYEMHVGTFTPEGTWMAAAEELPRLAELGVTVVEVMPVAEFPGRFGWGYDGVGLFAPFHGYGAPADFRRFVDAAHRAGLGVILDVVYNHLGPDGNHLGAFTPAYFSSTHTTDWGQAFDFDGPASAGVRELFVSNARHWTREYHLDGFRFDATQDIHDAGPEHILAELARAARAEAGARGVLLVAESEPQEVRLVLPREQGGHGLDLVGNEDFHHAALVALTGRREGYYENHLGGAQEILSAVKHGFLYQGQWYAWQGQRRGTPTRGLDRGHLLHFLENHDQVANSARGERLHRLTSPGRWRAFTALQLLSPQTPLLFQGQEFASSAPFLFFADHGPELALAVREGRRRFLSQFRDLADPETVARFADPGDPATFERCKLDPAERERNEAAVALHADLLALRREDPAFSRAIPCELDGAVLGERAFLLRWTAPEGERGSDRLLLVSWGTDLRLLPAPEPLLAPPPGFRWELLWSSESPRYGGRGTPPVETEAWNLAGEAAVVMAPRP